MGWAAIYEENFLIVKKRKDWRRRLADNQDAEGKLAPTEDEASQRMKQKYNKTLYISV